MLQKWGNEEDPQELRAIYALQSNKLSSQRTILKRSFDLVDIFRSVI